MGNPVRGLGLIVRNCRVICRPSKRHAADRAALGAFGRANAVKETHWLSYPNYAALVSGTTFSTGDLAEGNTDVFINVDLKTLETHAGLARVIIGSFLNAIYNRDGDAGEGALPPR